MEPGEVECAGSVIRNTSVVRNLVVVMYDVRFARCRPGPGPYLMTARPPH